MADAITFESVLPMAPLRLQVAADANTFSFLTVDAASATASVPFLTSRGTIARIRVQDMGDGTLCLATTAGA